MSLLNLIDKIFKKEGVVAYEDLKLQGLLLQKDIVSQNNILVDNVVIGNIYCAQKLLITANSEIRGNVFCSECTLEGKIFGNISATELLIVKSNSAITGNITTKKLQVEISANLNGLITILEEKEQLFNLPGIVNDKIKTLKSDRSDTGFRKPPPEKPGLKPASGAIKTNNIGEADATSTESSPDKWW